MKTVVYASLMYKVYIAVATVWHGVVIN